MGLLDNMFSGNPGQQGLLAGSMAMLNAGGPSRMPISLGQALAQGMGAGQAGYNQAIKRQQDAEELAMQKQYRDAQMASMKAKQDEEQRQREEQDFIRRTAAQFQTQPQPATGGMGQFNDSLPAEMQVPVTGAMPEIPGGFNTEGFLNAMAGRDPLAAAKMRKELLPEDGFATVGADGSIYNKRTGQITSTAPKTEKKPAPNFNRPFNDDGTPNLAYQKWELEKATRGRSLNSGGAKATPSYQKIADPANPGKEILVDADRWNPKTREGYIGDSGKETVTGVELTQKEKQKREAAYPKATAALKTFENSTSKLEEDIDRLIAHPGLNRITGLVGSRMLNMSDAARDAQAIYDRIAAKGGFSELSDMRASNPSGGALGSVSDSEGKYLRAAWGAIDQNQSYDSLKENLKRAKDQLKASKAVLKGTYDETYDYRQSDAKSKVDTNNPLLK